MKKRILTMSIVAIMAASNLAIGFAIPNQQNDFIEQSSAPVKDHPIPGKGHPKPGGGPMENPKLLTLLQVDENTLRAEREAGKTLVIIANEHGISEESLKEFMIAERTQHIDEDVKEGRISACQAQRIKADLEEHIVREINDPGPLPGKHRPGPPLPRPDLDEPDESTND
ncbi:MAG: hypothetical protein E6713_10965 [Sporomusaceae bacterium]|nr:hypothetical protein [Sporomusaceae bacterium]